MRKGVDIEIEFFRYFHQHIDFALDIRMTTNKAFFVKDFC